MKQAPQLKIIVIDDNVAIHQDFIKILTPKRATSNLSSLDDALFGGETATEDAMMPQFVIDTASQGQEGIDKIKVACDKGEPYSLAFVDIRMPPGLDGIETIKEIWKIAPDIQAVICTAFSDYTWEQTIQELGTNDNLLILKKPFDAIAVRQLACALTKKWQLIQSIAENTHLLEERVLERTSSLQKSLSLTRATLDSSIDGVIAVNNDGEIVDFNNQYIDMWGMPKEVFSQNNYEACLDYMIGQVVNADEFVSNNQKLAVNADEVSISSIRMKDGRVLERYSHPQKMNGKTIGRIWSFRDISARVSLESKLEHQATHDHLTGLPNRILLRDRIQNSIFTASRNKNKVGVLFFDLDRFKLINDSLGHEAGDELLKGVAQRLKPLLRESDTIARLGGDEFVIVISDVKHEKAIVDIGHKVLASFKEPFHISHRDLYITASIGISIYPEDGITVDELLRNADLAMYLAKKSGSNQFHFYTSDLNQQAVIRLEREEEMRSALANNEFYLLFQPQLDLDVNKIVSVEALVRWEHPIKGIIPPFDFIPFAEESGLIVPLGEWVMRQACIQCKIWQDMGYKDIRVGVNVATAQLKKENFVQSVKDILSETGVRPESLEVEITENVLFSHDDIMIAINELKGLGVQIALDDFGAGNSCLSFLKKINVDRVKIDQSFIQNILVDRSDEVIIQAIIDMAQSLDFNVLAEGVETQGQLDFIKERGCQSVQGYFFGKPMRAAEIESMLLKDKK